ncbi:hypothetical protein [Enterocloster lavalensis]|uniref:hypothetical protein n=1 Tax=Enterocloster lavalensis TaxID=460384 RepID=UPI0026668DB3|nr:hypothetical protein [Enterocloster lavalensis]
MRKTRRFQIKAAAAVIAAALLAGGCAGAESGAEGPTKVEETTTAAKAEPAAPESPEGVPGQQGQAGTREAGEPVNGYQLISDYGVTAPGDLQAYELPDGLRPAVEENQVRAELLTAVYINGEFRFRLRIEDSSVTMLTPEEVKEVQEKEAGDGSAQDGTAAPDDSYMEIDRDKGLYGRSAYEERLRAENPGGGGTLSVRLIGDGVAEGGYTPNRSSSTRQYVESGESGYLLTVGEYAMQGKPLRAEQPEGTYELWVPGFQEAIGFTLEPAPVYESLLDIPGMQEAGDYLIWTSGSGRDGQVEVQYFILPGQWEEDYRYSFLDSKLDYTRDGITESCGHSILSAQTRLNEPLSGIPPYRMTVQQTFAGPEAQEGGSYTLSLRDLLLTSPERSGEITLAIPQDVEQLDQEIEFEDSTIRFLKIELGDDPELYTIDDGVDVMRPVVYIEVQVTDRNPDRHLINLQGRKQASEPYITEVRPNVERTEKSYRSSQVVGLTVFYDEGDTEVRFSLENPQYVEDLELELPVLMEE